MQSFRFDDLAGETVVLTGAAWGIGRGLAPILAGQGIRLLLVDRDADAMREVAEGLRSEAAEVETFETDLAEPEQRKKLATALSKAAPNLLGIIHNAGIDPRQALENTSIDFFRHVMATNVEPAVELTRDLLPNLRQGGSGRVILIGSITFELGTALLSAYTASKGAVVGITRSLAHELGPEGINVNCIEPGSIRVEKQDRQYTEEIERRVLAAQSLKRELKPADLAGLTCLLLSEAGEAINGQVISVDGGFVHPWATADTQDYMLDRD
jgi:NAD(P)-dependent dehydrogenase (short-subunit alcohol dehydrogenase family)